MDERDEEKLLQSVALQNASSVLIARQRAEQELLRAKEELQARTAELTQSLTAMKATLEERDRARAEAEAARRIAQEANDAKGRFLRMISHELRTPLGAIDGYAALMADGIQGPLTEAQHDSVRRIRHNQKHLLRLVDELLDFARIESGKFAVKEEVVRLRQVFDNIHSSIAPQVAAKSLQLEVRLDDPELEVHGDCERIEQIVLNLLSNAVKFTPERGTITVTFTANSAYVATHVRDTGIGIAADKHEEIFESFYQVTPSLSSFGGTGLGLAISRQLAHAMGGELSVASTPGKGSTFTLTLRAARLPKV